MDCLHCVSCLFQGKINLKGSSDGMVVCTVSRAPLSRKENLSGSSAPMVAYIVSRASVSRKDEPPTDPPAPMMHALHVVSAVSKKEQPSNNNSFSVSRFVPLHVFDFGSSCPLCS